MALEIDDRVPNELSRSAKRDAAAALDLEDVYAFAPEEFRRSDEMLLLRGAAERHYRRVLDEKEDILRGCLGDSVTGQTTLELERFHIIQLAQRDSPQLALSHSASPESRVQNPAL